MEKREWLKEKQLMIYARTGYWVTQSSLDEVFISDDKIVLQQIEALKKLREDQPKLARDINSDLFELQTNPNHTTIKKYNELYATNMKNDIEEQYINILYYLSIFENANLTDKQKDLLIDIVSGYSYEGNAKNYLFMCKKLEKSKERVNKMSNDKKRKFTNEQLQKLFPSYYAKPNERWDEYLNVSRKLDCYIEDVEQSKRKGEYLRSISLKYSIFPLEIESDEVKK